MSPLLVTSLGTSAMQAQRTKATVPLIKEARRAILLSGTPALNKPKELFQQVHWRCCIGQGWLLVKFQVSCCWLCVVMPQPLQLLAVSAAVSAGALCKAEDDGVWRAVLPGEFVVGPSTSNLKERSLLARPCPCGAA